MKARKILYVPLFLSLALLAYGDSLQDLDEKTVPQDAQSLQWSFAPILKKVSPAIVNISAVRQTARSSLFENDPFFSEFFQALGEPTTRMKKSLGSAIVIDSKKGWILTNNHVINNAQDIIINLDDGKSYNADILWQDNLLDLAILKFQQKPKSLTAITFGNSDKLEVGDLALAVGNPFGLGKTVTMGIISAVDRQLGGSMGRFIQTDAAINPGNSGGGLITTKGELVGLNTLIISRSGGSQGLGFAVPSNLLSSLIEQIDDKGQRKQAWLGAVFENKEQKDADSSGVRAQYVWPKSAAAKAGLKAGDVIVKLNGRAVSSVKDLKLQEYYIAVGSIIELTLENNKQLKFKATEALEIPPRNPVTVTSDGLFYDVTFINRSPKVCQEMNLPLGQGGIVIADIPRRSLAAQMGFRVGDVLISLNNTPLTITEDIQKINMRRGNRWIIQFERDGQIHNVQIRY